MVFPLGMYATCTLRLAQAIDLPGLGVIARGFLLLALVAWAATAVGLLLELGKWMAAPRTEAARR